MTTKPSAQRRRAAASGARSTEKQQQPEPHRLSDRPASWKVWLTALRPHTLTASLSPVFVGYHATVACIRKQQQQQLAETDVESLLSSFRWLAVQWTLFCALIQIGTNLHNDYADFVKGADTDDRVGHARATQKGWLTPQTTARAANTVLGCVLAIGVGLWLQAYSSSSATRMELFILMILVLSSVFNAYAYTGGPWPLGYLHWSIAYNGWGDVFVLLYFGVVAATMLPWLCDMTLMRGASSSSQLDASCTRFVLPYVLAVSTLAINIIVVNNLRDRLTDVKASKKTLAVRFGATFCRAEYSVNVLLAFVTVVVMHQRTTYWPLLAGIPAFQQWHAVVLSGKDGADLNPHVGGTAKVQFVFCLLLGIGLRRAA